MHPDTFALEGFDTGLQVIQDRRIQEGLTPGLDAPEPGALDSLAETGDHLLKFSLAVAINRDGRRDGGNGIDVGAVCIALLQCGGVEICLQGSDKGIGCVSRGDKCLKCGQFRRDPT